MITVEELIKISDMHSRLRLIEDGQQIFIGYMFDLTDYSPELWEKVKNREVKRNTFHLDIKHKKWRELGLMEPLEPQIMATYQFSDLQTELYYEIHI